MAKPTTAPKLRKGLRNVSAITSHNELITKKKHLPFPYISIKKCVNTAEDIADVVVYNFVTGWLSGNAVSEYEEWELIYCLTFHCMPDFGLDKMSKSEQGAPNNHSLEEIWEVQK